MFKALPKCMQKAQKNREINKFQNPVMKQNKNEINCFLKNNFSVF